MLAEYHIPVEWKVSAVMVVESKSLREALSIAHIRPLPKEYKYVSGSFEANEQEAKVITEIMNQIKTPITRKY